MTEKSRYSLVAANCQFRLVFLTHRRFTISKTLAFKRKTH